MTISEAIEQGARHVRSDDMPEGAFVEFTYSEDGVVLPTHRYFDGTEWRDTHHDGEPMCVAQLNEDIDIEIVEVEEEEPEEEVAEQAEEPMESAATDGMNLIEEQLAREEPPVGPGSMFAIDGREVGQSWTVTHLDVQTVQGNDHISTALQFVVVGVLEGPSAGNVIHTSTSGVGTANTAREAEQAALIQAATRKGVELLRL